jgi:hypothetical protein
MAHICAWCHANIGTHSGQVSGRLATNFGMCVDCRRERLGPAPLAVRELKRARRMRKCGRSLRHIGWVLGVDEPSVEAALRAA